MNFGWDARTFIRDPTVPQSSVNRIIGLEDKFFRLLIYNGRGTTQVLSHKLLNNYQIILVESNEIIFKTLTFRKTFYCKR